MSSKVSLKVEPRSEMGKGSVRALRREGFVPAVIYGHGEETMSCKVDRRELERLMTSTAYESTLIDLKLDGGSKQVLIREVQFHPYRAQVLHIDFLAVHRGEKIRLQVPVHLIGTAAGVKEGGILEHQRHEIEIRCAPSAIPERLEHDISALTIGDNLVIRELVVPEDVEVMDDLSATICSVVPPAAIIAEEAEAVEEVEGEEETPEPEVVGRGKVADEESKEEES